MSGEQAGDGAEQSTDGLALNASLSEPWGTALSDDGESLFWAEFGGSRLTPAESDYCAAGRRSPAEASARGLRS